MRILGIDPGIAIVGYGVVDKEGNRYKTIAYDAVTTKDITIEGGEWATAVKKVFTDGKVPSGTSWQLVSFFIVLRTFSTQKVKENVSLSLTSYPISFSLSVTDFTSNIHITTFIQVCA